MKRRSFLQILAAAVTVFPLGREVEAQTTVVTPAGKPWTEKDFKQVDFGVVTGRQATEWPCVCGAKIPDDFSKFESHLVTCPSCGEEYRVDVHFPEPTSDWFADVDPE